MSKLKRRFRLYLDIIKCSYEDGLYIRKLDGYRISTNSPSLHRMYASLKKSGTYNFLTETNEPYIIDCGANIGLATLYFKKLFPNSKILCFEPSKDVIPILEKNIRDNNLTNITVLPYALHNVETTVKFNTDEKMSGTISAHKNLPLTYDVQTKLLSHYIDKEVDFLKIDIEGAEMLVVPEIEDKINLVKNIFIEYHSFISDVQELDKICSLLTKNGFRYYIEGEYDKIENPLIKFPNNLEQDLQLCIWAKRIENININKT